MPESDARSQVFQRLRREEAHLTRILDIRVFPPFAAPQDRIQHVSARDLSLRSGRLDWSWDGGRVNVFLSGFEDLPRIRLGANFPSGAELNVRDSGRP